MAKSWILISLILHGLLQPVFGLHRVLPRQTPLANTTIDSSSTTITTASPTSSSTSLDPGCQTCYIVALDAGVLVDVEVHLSVIVWYTTVLTVPLDTVSYYVTKYNDTAITSSTTIYGNFSTLAVSDFTELSSFASAFTSIMTGGPYVPGDIELIPGLTTTATPGGGVAPTPIVWPDSYLAYDGLNYGNNPELSLGEGYDCYYGFDPALDRYIQGVHFPNQVYFSLGTLTDILQIAHETENGGVGCPDGFFDANGGAELLMQQPGMSNLSNCNEPNMCWGPPSVKVPVMTSTASGSSTTTVNGVYGTSSKPTSASQTSSQPGTSSGTSYPPTSSNQPPNTNSPPPGNTGTSSSNLGGSSIPGSPGSGGSSSSASAGSGESNTQPPAGGSGGSNTQPPGAGSGGANTQPAGGGSGGSNTLPPGVGSGGSNTQPPAVGSTPVPLLPIGGTTYTPTSGIYTISTLSISIGSSLTTFVLGGTTYALSPSGTALVVGGTTTIALATAPATSGGESVPPQVVIGGTTYTENSASVYIIGSSVTITPGGAPFTISGTTYSIGPSGTGVVVVGGGLPSSGGLGGAVTTSIGGTAGIEPGSGSGSSSAGGSNLGSGSTSFNPTASLQPYTGAACGRNSITETGWVTKSVLLSSLLGMMLW